jgi:hypothetical protein
MNRPGLDKNLSLMGWVHSRTGACMSFYQLLIWLLRMLKIRERRILVIPCFPVQEFLFFPRNISNYGFGCIF